MNETYKIRYTSPQIGYATEHIQSQSSQGAINLIRARIPDASINSIEIHRNDQTQRHDNDRR